MIEKVRVFHGVYDASIQDDIDNNDVAVTSATSFSDMTVATNVLKTEDKIKVPYLEDKYFFLDGSFIYANSGDVGIESASLSDQYGDIDETVTFVFENKHSSVGIMLNFQPQSVAKNFNIKYYDENDDQIGDTISIADNTKQNCVLVGIYENWVKVVFQVTKIQPYQRARLWSIVFGINETYTEDDLLTITASRATAIVGDYDDCGTCNLQIFNDGFFNIQSVRDFPAGVRENTEIALYTKNAGDNDYSLYMTYYASETNVSENGYIIVISAYDVFYKLGMTKFKSGAVDLTGTKSLADWANEVAADCGVTITIDDDFETMYSTGYITEVSHREAFRLIAEAGCGYIKVNPDGSLALKKLDTEASAAETFTEDDIVDSSLAVNIDGEILGLKIVEHTFIDTQSSAITLGHLENVSLLTGIVQELEIVYSQYPVKINSVNIYVDTTTSATFTSVIYSDRCIVYLSGTTGDETFVTVTGEPYAMASEILTRGSATRIDKTIDKNYLITNGLGADVADFQAKMLIGRVKYSAEIWDLPDDILASKVLIDDENIYVEREEFSKSATDFATTIKGTSDNG